VGGNRGIGWWNPTKRREFGSKALKRCGIEKKGGGCNDSMSL